MLERTLDGVGVDREDLARRCSRPKQACFYGDKYLVLGTLLTYLSTDRLAAGSVSHLEKVEGERSGVIAPFLWLVTLPIYITSPADIFPRSTYCTYLSTSVRTQNCLLLPNKASIRYIKTTCGIPYIEDWHAFTKFPVPA